MTIDIVEPCRIVLHHGRMLFPLRRMECVGQVYAHGGFGESSVHPSGSGTFMAVSEAYANMLRHRAYNSANPVDWSDEAWDE